MLRSFSLQEIVWYTIFFAFLVLFFVRAMSLIFFFNLILVLKNANSQVILKYIELWQLRFLLIQLKIN